MDADHHGVAEIARLLRAAGCVFAEREAAILLSSARNVRELERMTGERASGTPLEHVVGWAAFAGIRIPVDLGVFVPRPRTELLVRRALRRVSRGGALVDVCTGTGVVASAIASRVPVAVAATDVDSTATANARRTLSGYDAVVVTCSLFDGLPTSWRGRADIITMVAPYVPHDEIDLLPREARDFEASVALDGGADGLDIVRAALDGVHAWLAPGGSFLTEVAEHQAPLVVSAVEAAGLRSSVSVDNGACVVEGTLPTLG
ncbi:release factor glutamine methyltransferase [Microbacteriaceae bacterium SG_E_30_P1]|uniref:Release factor glutamine methyltransferase n=1 Tax=Antiquaquibacter oligotrophicus TaxID=2880260 RepID=A0ABT6KM44_9MICO|nr:methyltransferase [Antiquaquibacter oligotrophicus]MDH6181083.1 release factor glutamine methyltransferase [Antiquaquibacter oligotrophicus]UDF13219.1 methyltransferase [Antiquaquibacter oligotrophicus]